MSEDISGKVKGWMEKEGILKEEIEDENAEFHFAGEFPPESNQNIEVIKPRDKEKVVIGSRISLSDEHFKALHSLPKKQRDDFLWQIRFDLLFRGPEFRMIPSASDFKSMEFTKTLYPEELIKSKFMLELREIFRCKLYLVWRMSQMVTGKDESEGLYR